MVVMKAETVSGIGQGAAVFSFRDVETDAREIVDAAKRRSEQIETQAQEKAKEINNLAQQQGYEKGFEKGLEEGKEKGEKKALLQATSEFKKNNEKIVATLKDVFEKFQNDKARLIWEAQQGAIGLAVMIARKVTKQIVADTTKVTEDNVKAALEMITSNSNAIVKINPADMKHMEKVAANSDVVLGSYDNSVKFEADSEVGPGGCVVTTECGQIDAKLDTQIERIAEELLKKSEETKNLESS